jgi:hypothetical protein
MLSRWPCCSCCHRSIEVDVVYSVLGGLVPLLGLLTFFRLDLPMLAMPLVFYSVVYGIWFRGINARWFPLKCYDD